MSKLYEDENYDLEKQKSGYVYSITTDKWIGNEIWFTSCEKQDGEDPEFILKEQNQTIGYLYASGLPDELCKVLSEIDNSS